MYALIAGLQRYIHLEGKRPEVDFLTQPVLAGLKMALYAEMKQLAADGIEKPGRSHIGRTGRSTMDGGFAWKPST